MPETSLDIQIKTLPNQPGVYQYFDADDKLIYVGKAKNIKKRKSYDETKNISDFFYMFGGLMGLAFFTLEHE